MNSIHTYTRLQGQRPVLSGSALSTIYKANVDRALTGMESPSAPAPSLDDQFEDRGTAGPRTRIITWRLQHRPNRISTEAGRLAIGDTIGFDPPTHHISHHHHPHTIKNIKNKGRALMIDLLLKTSYGARTRDPSIASGLARHGRDCRGPLKSRML